MLRRVRAVAVGIQLGQPAAQLHLGEDHRAVGGVGVVAAVLGHAEVGARRRLLRRVQRLLLLHVGVVMVMVLLVRGSDSGGGGSCCSCRWWRRRRWGLRGMHLWL